MRQYYADQVETDGEYSGEYCYDDRNLDGDF
jgi:hypothetical protein